MGKKILIIDDEPDIIFYLETILGNNGYEVVSASDAMGGLEQAKKCVPDLICLDIMMPRRSGMSMYRDLKKDKSLKNIPVVILSAIGSAYGVKSPKFRKLFPEKEVPKPEAFFDKPLDVAKFLKFIEKLLETNKNK
ncbi:response regulator [Elusimicrobiota bacterium]